MAQEQSQAYIVRQPIHNRDHELVAYEVMYVEGEDQPGEGRSQDAEAAHAIESLLIELRDDGFLEGRDVLLNMTPGLLMRNVPEIFDPAHLIIQIDEQVLLSAPAMKLVKKYRDLNYRIALQGFEFNGRYLSALDQVDIVKVNYSEKTDVRESVVSIAKNLGLTTLAFNVNTEKSCRLAEADSVDLLEGSYIGTTLPAKVQRVKHLQSNFFQLMGAVTRDEPDLEKIEELISRDVTLTYGILKLVNSAYFALRKKTESVKQALVILGIGQLRQWIYLLSFQADSDIPSEFIKTSFLRANFCSELASYVSELPISQNEAYLMGMFSTLGALLDVPLEDALAQLNLSEAVNQALLEHSGKAGKLYDLVLRYEEGDWVGMSNDAEELGVPTNVVSQKYFECTHMVNDIWAGLTGVRS